MNSSTSKTYIHPISLRFDEDWHRNDRVSAFHEYLICGQSRHCHDPNFCHVKLLVMTHHLNKRSEKYLLIFDFLSRLWFLSLCHQAWIINEMDITMTIRWMKWHLWSFIDITAKFHQYCSTPWQVFSHKRKTCHFKNAIFAWKTRWPP